MTKRARPELSQMATAFRAQRSTLAKKGAVPLRMKAGQTTAIHSQRACRACFGIPGIEGGVISGSRTRQLSYPVPASGQAAKGLRMNNMYILLRPPGPLARRERRAYPMRYVRSEQRSQRACGPQPKGARRRAGICGVAAPRRCPPASPASRRLASARPALAPKCTCYSCADPNYANPRTIPSIRRPKNTLCPEWTTIAIHVLWKCFAGRANKSAPIRMLPGIPHGWCRW